MRIRLTLVDAYNLLHVVPRLVRLLRSDGDAARRALVEHVRTHPAPRGDVVLVFDGIGEPILSAGRVRVVFSHTRTADDWIRTALERERDARAVLVVSSDGQVRAHALACGARVMGSLDFMKAEEGTSPRADEKHERPLSRAEIDMWKRLFEAGRDEEA